MKKGNCLFCDNERSMADYRAEATLEYIEGTLEMFKLCNSHARELDAFHAEKEKLEIERTVA